MKLKPSAKKVLRALEAAGDKGLLTRDLCHPDVGGERFGGRIQELRKAGYVVVSRYDSPSSWRYILVRFVPAPAAGRPVVAGSPNRAPGGDGHETDEDAVLAGLAFRSWRCLRCGWARVDGPECPYGHQATRSIELDFTDRRRLATVEHILLPGDDLPVAA